MFIILKGTNTCLSVKITSERGMKVQALEERKKILNTAILAGELLLKNGAEIFRVQDTIDRIFESYGVTDGRVYVISNGIFITIGENTNDNYGAVRDVMPSTIRLDMIIKVNAVSREICEKKYSPEEAMKKLNDCTKVDKDNMPFMAFACGMGSGAFCYILGASITECIVATVLGILLQIFLMFMSGKNMSYFFSCIIGSAIVTLGSAAAVRFGINGSFNKIVIGSVISLFPGVVFTTSVRELFNSNYVSGIIHLMIALMTAVCIASGVGAALVVINAIGGV